MLPVACILVTVNIRCCDVLFSKLDKKKCWNSLPWQHEIAFFDQGSNCKPTKSNLCLWPIFLSKMGLVTGQSGQSGRQWVLVSSAFQNISIISPHEAQSFDLGGFMFLLDCFAVLDSKDRVNTLFNRIQAEILGAKARFVQEAFWFVCDVIAKPLLYRAMLGSWNDVDREVSTSTSLS